MRLPASQSMFIVDDERSGSATNSYVYEKNGVPSTEKDRLQKMQ